jgi:aryl-alcohol dehydrogenase-like predicted oxidoreductase
VPYLTAMSLVDPGPRRLGPLFEVGPLGFGCWRLTTTDDREAQALVEAALDAGMRLVDTADVYGLDWGGHGFGTNEEVLGRVLRAAPHLRDRMVLATKGGIRPPVPYDSSAAWLREACEASLRRLGVETVDLYQVHRPDLFTHPAEVAAVLQALVDEGKVRAVGVSNHTPAQVAGLHAFLDVPLVSTQPELSVARLDPLRDGSLDQAMRLGLAVLAWSPLAGGRVATGEGLRPELVAELDRIAEREEVDRAAVALAFVLALPSRPVAIVGTQRPARVAAATAALRVRLYRPDLYALVQASDGVPLP